MTLTVWARTPDKKRRGQLDLVGAKAVLRDTDVGTWVLTVDGASPVAAAFTKGWGVQVFEDGQYRFSGPATEIGRTYSGESSQAPELEISGVTDDHVLKDRLVYPSWDKAAGEQAAAYYQVKGQPAETIITDLINRQAGPAALPARRTPGLAGYTSQGRGSTSSVNARFSVLLDEVRTIAQTSGLVVSVAHMDLDPTLQVSVRSRADRSRAVRFRTGHGLSKVSASFVSPTANSVLVAGGGQGAARVIKEHLDVSADWASRRVEVFQDRRDTTEADELEKAGKETLQEGRGTAKATFEVTESDVARYGVHFQLGDTVTLDLGAVQVVEPVRVVELEWDEYGRTTTKITVGDPAAEDEETTPAVDRQVRALSRAVHDLSTRL